MVVKRAKEKLPDQANKSENELFNIFATNTFTFMSKLFYKCFKNVAESYDQT